MLALSFADSQVDSIGCGASSRTYVFWGYAWPSNDTYPRLHAYRLASMDAYGCQDSSTRGVCMAMLHGRGSVAESRAEHLQFLPPHSFPDTDSTRRPS